MPVLAAGDPAFACCLIPMVLVVMMVVIVAVRNEAAKVRVGWVTYRNRDEFREQFGAALGLWGVQAGNGPGPTSIQFSGTLPGATKAHVSFTVAPGKGAGFFVHMAIAVDEAPSLIVTREDFTTRLQKMVGLKHEVEVGDRAFDDRYLLETTDPRAARALTARPLRDEIDWLFREASIERFELGKGSLSATSKAESGSPNRIKEIFERLEKVARLVARVPITVRVLGGERRALVGVSGLARCGYCHEDVTGDEADLVACDHCRTVAHEECWAELGRCPVIGCPGRAPERGTRLDEPGTRVD